MVSKVKTIKNTGNNKNISLKKYSAWTFDDKHNDIYRTIRDRICLQKYPPGTILREIEFAKEFGISRTPIRQVLYHLQVEGLVKIHNGVGTIVTGVDLNDFLDTYKMWMKISEFIGEMSRKQITAEDVAIVNNLLNRAKKLEKSGDLEEYWKIQHDEHYLIWHLIENKTLKWLWDLFYYQTARIWYSFASKMWEESIKSLIAELTGLIQAFENGDIHTVGYIYRNSISMHVYRIKRYLDSSSQSTLEPDIIKTE